MKWIASHFKTNCRKEQQQQQQRKNTAMDEHCFLCYLSQSMSECQFNFIAHYLVSIWHDRVMRYKLKCDTHNLRTQVIDGARKRTIEWEMEREKGRKWSQNLKSLDNDGNCLSHIHPHSPCQENERARKTLQKKNPFAINAEPWLNIEEIFTLSPFVYLFLSSFQWRGLW